MNDFYFDELVVGGSLTALLYAYKKNLPILIDVAHIPFVLEEAPTQWDLSFLGFNKGGYHKKSQVWDRLSFLLAMAGLVIFPNNIQSFRLEDDNINIIGLDNKSLFFIASFSSLSVFPTPEKTILSGLIFAFKAFRSSPSETTSAPDPNLDNSEIRDTFELDLTEKQISGFILLK